MGWSFLFFQAEDGIRDLVRSRGLGDVYKRQHHGGGDLRGYSGAHAGALRRQGGNSRLHDPGLELSLIHI